LKGKLPLGYPYELPLMNPIRGIERHLHEEQQRFNNPPQNPIRGIESVETTITHHILPRPRNPIRGIESLYIFMLI